jgi:Amidohydrolase
VGFDPIRAILAPNGYNPAGGTALPTIDPHHLVREAITKHGFLGVKLYPPMGSRAWHNGKPDISFSPRVKKYVDLVYNGITDQQLGKLIDRELEKLYKFCAAEGVPILAHAYNSNQADECSGWRASPQYWGEVIDKFSTLEKPLRLCLGHFGSFDAHTKNAACVSNSFASKAWEIIFAGILARPGGEFVFADLSYLSEVIDRSEGWQERRKKIRDQFKSFLKTGNRDEHLCYGSDWLMLGLESGHDRYHVELGNFLRDDVGLSPTQLANIFFGNAVRFLGLRPGDQNRLRLEKFYDDNDIGDFPQLDALV